jgi:tetratricopeptide (TPR) repeat protein
MDDRLEEARTLAAAAVETLAERGDASIHHVTLAEIEMLAGSFESADAHLRIANDYYLTHGALAFSATISAMCARGLCVLGRYAEAAQLAAEARERSHQSDAFTQACSRQVAALVHAERGDLAEAERLAREAVAFVQTTDSPQFQGDALYDLGEVLTAAADRAGAVAAFRDALACYERKGIVPLARRTRERLAALQATTPGPGVY